MAWWLRVTCLVVVVAALAGCFLTGERRRQAPGARRRRAGWLTGWPRLAGRIWSHWLSGSVWSWRLIAVTALVLLASQSLAQSDGGPQERQSTATPAAESPGPPLQSEVEAAVRKKRAPELVALQWNPTSQPSLEPSESVTPPSAQPPAPPPPRVVPPPAAPDGAIVGRASWYGIVDGFGPEDTMADGSQFNPLDPTIGASNRWPLGSWLRVCRGDRCIEVQVRDRGAFNHALDLSYAAFSQLASPSAGVITVTILRVR